MRVVDQLLGERGADALRDAAVELALHHHGVDGAPAVVDGHVAQDAHRARLHVDLHHAGVGAEGPGDGTRVEVPAGVEPGFAPLAGEDGAAHGGAREGAEGDAARGHAGHVGAPAGQHHVVGGALQRLGGHEPRAARDLAGGARDGRARHGGHPAGDGAHPVGDHAGVAADHADLVDLHAQLRRADLGQGRLVGLALAGDADEEIHGAAGIDADVGALEGADAGALDVGGHAEPEGPRWSRGAAAARRATPRSRGGSGRARTRPHSRRDRR